MESISTILAKNVFFVKNLLSSSGIYGDDQKPIEHLTVDEILEFLQQVEGWEVIGYDYNSAGINCHWCHTKIKHITHMSHPNGTVVDVGTMCGEKVDILQEQGVLVNITDKRFARKKRELREYIKREIGEAYVAWFKSQAYLSQDIKDAIAFIYKWKYPRSEQEANMLISCYQVTRKFKTWNILDDDVRTSIIDWEISDYPGECTLVEKIAIQERIRTQALLAETNESLESLEGKKEDLAEEQEVIDQQREEIQIAEARLEEEQVKVQVARNDLREEKEDLQGLKEQKFHEEIVEKFVKDGRKFYLANGLRYDAGFEVIRDRSIKLRSDDSSRYYNPRKINLIISNEDGTSISVDGSYLAEAIECEHVRIPRHIMDKCASFLKWVIIVEEDGELFIDNAAIDWFVGAFGQKI